MLLLTKQKGTGGPVIGKDCVKNIRLFFCCLLKSVQYTSLQFDIPRTIGWQVIQKYVYIHAYCLQNVQLLKSMDILKEYGFYSCFVTAVAVNRLVYSQIFAVV